MCIAPNTDKMADKKKETPRKATDVPLGDGLADSAKLSLLTRREKIRQAVEGE